MDIFCLIFPQGFGSENDSEWPMWLETLTTLSHLLVVINSSVNFGIYLLKRNIRYPASDCHKCRQSRQGMRNESASTGTGECPRFMHRFHLELEESVRSNTVRSERSRTESWGSGGESLISRSSRIRKSQRSQRRRMRVSTVECDAPDIIQNTSDMQPRSESVCF